MVDLKTFKSQPHKMVKYTQTIRPLLPTNYLIVLDHFVRLALKSVKNTAYQNLQKRHVLEP